MMRKASRSRVALMTLGGKWSATLLDCLPRLVERIHQNPHLVVVKGASERVFCQELEHGPTGTEYLRTSSCLNDNDNFAAAYQMGVFQRKP